MISRVLMISLLSFIIFSFLNADMVGQDWYKLGSYIVAQGNNQNKQDFEAAKQMLLYIKDNNQALILANSISKKWSAFTTRADLTRLTRYPVMNVNDVEKAGKELFQKHRDFINNTLKMNCNIPNN